MRIILNEIITKQALTKTVDHKIETHLKLAQTKTLKSVSHYIFTSISRYKQIITLHDVSK